MAAGAGTAVPLATGAASALPAATSAASGAGAGSTGLFDAILGGAQSSLGSMQVGSQSLSELLGSGTSFGDKVGTLAGDALKSTVTSQIKKALNPTTTTSPMLGTAQAPTGLDTAAAQNRPQATGSGSFQANVGPGYQLSEKQMAKIAGLSDDEAEVLRRILSSDSGLSNLTG
jgi:hypothetical protein